MNLKKLLVDFVTTFVLFLVVTVVVTYLYSLIIHGNGIVDWETSFRFAIIFGITVPLIRARDMRQKEKAA